MEGEGERYTSDSDPNKVTLSAAQDNMRPDFSPDASEHKKKDYSDPFSEERNRTATFLNGKETEASAKPNRAGRGGDKTSSLREKEGNVESDGKEEGKFKSAVKGVKDLKRGKIKSGKGRLKKAGPIFAILALFGGVGGASFFGQMAMPFSFISQIQESFDSISVSQNLRSRNFLRYQTSGDKVKDCRKAHYFKADEFKPTKRQTKKLAQSGITFEEEGGILVMKHTNNDGEVRTIVADKNQAGGNRVYFDDMYNNDVEFRKAYNDGAKTWKGSVSAWFDSSMTKLLKHLNINTRNKWADFDSGAEDSREKMKKVVTDEIDGDMEGKTRGRQPPEEYDTEYNEDTKKREKVAESEKYDLEKDIDDENLKKSEKLTKADAANGGSGVRTKLTTLAKSVSNGASLTANIYCGAQDIVAAISAMVAAYQMTQVLKLTATIFEGIQKSQAGDGSTSPIHDIGASMTQRTKSTYEEVGGLRLKAGSDDEYEADESKTKVTEHERSAMEAEAVTALYAGRTVNPNDPSVKSLNIHTLQNNMFSAVTSDGVFGNIVSHLSGVANNMDRSASAFRKCTIARLAAAGMQLVKDTIEVVADIGACVATGGISCILSVVKKKVADGVRAVVQNIIVSAIVSIAVPHVVKMITRKMVTEVAGEDLGNALIDGANLYMGGNHQYSGGAVANKESLVSFLQEQDKYIAEKAQEERDSLSPFDITSKYTFLGSLANQMIPLASSMTSLTSTVQGIGSVFGNAFTSLMPESSAVSAAIEAQARADLTEKTNPYLYDIGGVGDAFGNPYFITDTRTISQHPADVIDSIGDDDIEVKTDSDGNATPQVVKDSKLAKYIVFCGQRTSPFGMSDQNIANSIDKVGNATASSGAQFILGALEPIGDIADIMSNEAKLKNYGWISGESCVIDNQAYGEESVKWNEANKFQRFIEDQRLAEAEGIIEESAVTKYLAEYYEEHPLDYSPEGIIARYSGQTKEAVIAMIDYIKVSEFIADYHPASYYPYVVEEQAESEITIEQDETAYIPSVKAILTNIIYDERRNYYFAA